MIAVECCENCGAPCELVQKFAGLVSLPTCNCIEKATEERVDVLIRGILCRKELANVMGGNLTMETPYEVLLDVAKLCLEKAADHPDCMTYHQRRLVEMQGELDAMYGAVVSNKGLVD